MGEAADKGGTFVDRYDHALQAGTRALRDGRDEEYVACALLHDIGDVLGSYHHAELSACILQPFVSERRLWMVRHHAELQRHTFVSEDGVHYDHYLGVDPMAAAKFVGHPYLADTLEFCERYDQPSYAVGYEAEPIETFFPLVERLFAKPR